MIASTNDPWVRLTVAAYWADRWGARFINIGAALSVVPLTGVPLPLVSIGGTSLLAVLAGIGILLNIATNRRSFIVVSRRGPDGAARRRRDGGSPVAGAGRRR